jgi:O-antigen/teichoic acid export membrane protein
MRLRTLVSKLVSVTALRLGMAGLGFALFWLLSHHLSPAELGGFSLLMGIFMFLQMLPLLGLNVHVVREMAAHPQGQAEEIAAAASLALLMCGLMAGALCAYALLQADGALKTPLVLLGLSLLPTGWVVVAESALVGRERLSVLTTVNLLENAWRVGGAALSLWLGWGLVGVFAFLLAGRLLAALAYALSDGVPTLQVSRMNRQGLRRYLGLVPTYLGLCLVSAACSRIDVLLLSKLRDLEDVAVYAAAAKLYEASLMVSTMALMIVYPVLARLFTSDKAAFAATLARSLRWGLLGAPLVLLGMALAPLLVHTLYSPKLWASVPVLQALLLGSWLMAIDQLLSITMLAANAQRDDLHAMAIGLLTLIVALTTLSPMLGPIGAAWAVVAGLALRVLWRVRWAQAELGLAGLLAQALGAYLSAGLGAVCFLTMSHQGWRGQLASPWLVVVSLVAACLAHALAATLTGAFGAKHKQDWAQWRHKPQAASGAVA